jgi:hypothetical protein
MTGNAFLSHISNLSSYRSHFASDPINLTNHEREHASARENSMRSFMHQNSIAVFEKANNKEVSKELRLITTCHFAI